jgi:4'-phosphopantetheinyl transferase
MGSSADVLVLGRVDLAGALALLLVDPGQDGEMADVWLRDVLRGASGRPDIELIRRPSGRPSLGPPYHELGVSISRRCGLVLAGFAPDRAVGVDVERGNAVSSDEVVFLAKDHFALREAAAVADRPEEAARDLFLRLWVSKEAALKTTGRGIYDGVDEPDLHLHLAEIVASAPITVSAGRRTPMMTLGCKTWKLSGAGLIYGALAVGAVRGHGRDEADDGRGMLPRVHESPQIDHDLITGGTRSRSGT